MGALFVKTCRGGYDGRSQARVATAAEAPGAWTALGERRSVAEQALDLAAELSVMVARRPSGEVRVYPPALNFHERQILAWSVLPAPLSNTVASRAEEIARGIATAFELEGILAVELFLLGDDSLLVNELAPRPHNSFHETEVACSTSQFEQLVRAVCDLPLGETRALRPGAIYNLFGDLWLRGDGAPRFEAALSRPGVRLHLYGKPGARAGRKMGHLSAIGDTADDALARVRDAAATLTESFT
jgi:5-(carboxyamino)imidazole ribonucleotide synthase